MNLLELGFSNEYLEKHDEKTNGMQIGRIITVNKESYIISDGENEYFGKLTGNLIYSSESPVDFPTVGDFVLFQNFENEDLGIIHKILPRKTLLKRKSAGKNIEFQLIAANVDFAIIMQALDIDFNINRLERYLSMIYEFKVEPIILFSKTDLVSADELNDLLNKVKASYCNIKIIAFSNFDTQSFVGIKDLFLKQKTYCLIGSSGVGKTTLINNLIGKDEFKTREIREKDNRGKHTTTSRQLIFLDNGSILIDTPGMRELANISISGGIDTTFDEISELAKNCKFSDCTHTVEKGCAILEAIETGDLDEKRFMNFIKLKKESDYYERSYVDRRKKDKEFGKMVKSVLKSKNDKFRKF